MGGIAQFGLSQLCPDPQAALVQQTAPAPPLARPQPATPGYSSDISNPAAMPINSPVAPGSTGDLEARAAAAPQQTAQTFQNQQQPQPRPGQYSPDNPHAKLRGR